MRVSLALGPAAVEVPLSVDDGGAAIRSEVLPPCRYRDRDPYEGSYEVTPSATAQVLATGGHTMTADIVIDPIPSNYGLITWNGSTLTVS